MKVTAGPHKVGVTFVARTFAESDDVLYSFTSGRGRGAHSEGRQRRDRRARSTRPGSATRRAASACFVCRPATEARRAAVRDADPRDARARGVPPAGDGRGSRGAARVLRERPRGAATSRPASAKALTAILASPKFLYPRRARRPQAARRARSIAISDLELASRLSFFLWSGCRTTSCWQLAEQGKLSDAEGARGAGAAHAGRSARRSRWSRTSRSSGCSVRELDEIEPDPVLFPNFDDGPARRVPHGDGAVRRQRAPRGPQRARPADARTTRS